MDGSKLIGPYGTISGDCQLPLLYFATSIWSVKIFPNDRFEKSTDALFDVVAFVTFMSPIVCIP
jgi:hypothetical protein